MSKMDELYNGMYDYCEEVQHWNVWMTAKEWNESLRGEYGPACFTALVNSGKIERRKGYKSTSYEYCIVPTDKIKEMMEQLKRNKEKENAEYIINHYDESVARKRACYEEVIRIAKEQLARDLEWEAEKLEKAKATLAQMF